MRCLDSAHEPCRTHRCAHAEPSHGAPEHPTWCTTLAGAGASHERCEDVRTPACQVDCERGGSS